ncbi:MAG: 2-hydroxychromene-2-carboxylate isomerase [Candidatus Binatia bacterium]|nr:MAG: 2-hydroxychromene-2-carboxylate isomerase [Candidatus Binatia bacterium]
MPKLEFFYDYASPFSYLADTQIPALAERTGAEVAYRPMLLGAVLQATGNSPPANVAAKARYMLVDLQRWAEHYGVAFHWNPVFPQRTLGALRGALVAIEEGCFESYHGAAFRAIWVEKRDLSDASVLRDLFARAGLDPERGLERSSAQEIKDRLRENTDEAVRRGAFGAPTFFVGEQMFWGNDRLLFVEKALRS